MQLTRPRLMAMTLLPIAEPKCPGNSFSWQYHPCTALGGDALDIYRIDDDLSVLGLERHTGEA